jgi:Bacterial Ig-like domain (group 3)
MAEDGKKGNSMRWATVRLGGLILFLHGGTQTVLAQTPTITNVTNAAIPAIDYPPGPVHLVPGSIASIFGTNLADSTVSISPPWQTALAGTEVHLIVEYISLGNANVPCGGTCELVAELLYASPTQINFVVPSAPAYETSRIVLIRDGARFDTVSTGPGLIYLDAIDGDSAVFGVGYDCLFSFSLSDPSACGLSWTPGQNRALAGAVTDTSGRLINFQNPVTQGQVIVVYLTGLSGLAVDPATALIDQAHPSPLGFGIAQNGTDIPATVSTLFGLQYGLVSTPVPLWAGQSPQFVGLDQINVNFPVCNTATKATVESRYDAFLSYTSATTGTAVRIYLPFLVSVGDPNCSWTTQTTTTVASSANPSISGQAVTFTATVLPSTATGAVTFLDGTSKIGTSTLTNGAATLSISTLAAGMHSITAGYGGNSQYTGSVSSALTQTVSIAKASTTTTLTSSPVSGGVSFVASVSPMGLTGTVTFLDFGNALGSAPLNQPIVGGAQLTGQLLPGAHSISAQYGGNSNYNGSTSASVAWTGTNTTLTSSLNPSTVGQSVILTATVSPSTAVGSVTFSAAGLPILCAETGTLSNGQAKCTANLASGAHSILAAYSGEANPNYSGSSGSLTQTVK